jgi:hypothetical protein
VYFSTIKKKREPGQDTGETGFSLVQANISRDPPSRKKPLQRRKGLEGWLHPLSFHVKALYISVN